MDLSQHGLVGLLRKNTNLTRLKDAKSLEIVIFHLSHHNLTDCKSCKFSLCCCSYLFFCAWSDLDGWFESMLVEMQRCSCNQVKAEDLELEIVQSIADFTGADCEKSKHVSARGLWSGFKPYRSIKGGKVYVQPRLAMLFL